MAKKKSKGKQPSTNNEYWIKEELFEQSTGIKDKGKTYKEFLKVLDGKDYYWKVIVVSIDIRNSSIALVNVEDFQSYQDTICDFVCYIAATWRLKNKLYENIKKSHIHFFDKFTGDGAVFFLALPNIDEKANPEEFKQRLVTSLKETIQYCNDIVIKFLESVLPEIRKSCGLLPTDFGLSIGIDAGECLITDMRYSEEYKDDYEKEYNEARKYEEDYNKNNKDKENNEIKDIFEDIGGNITVIGRPIIGASRMVQIAAPYEIIINSYGGSNLYADRAFKHQLRKRLDTIKEYKNCIEVYSVVSSGIVMSKEKAEVFSHNACEQVKEIKVLKK